ncbi:50S ribosomal protein L18a [Methanomicrobium antiquum]|uniref:Large ribosomal subunit protein eL20 n=1 Tax=Methanomicrobium antiquum TaxID=487686 RepID=A0AAF0FSZ1_9EURY|nr:50S ribosomal protein L18Ae [Methanomicrobium antiquum]MDD3976896.1 50S ribosomal protein L18Ae [Methanomicrobium sp.]WFN37561.1 50S ribosomal protein L18a [Methanomicrobium antiquum]
MADQKFEVQGNFKSGFDYQPFKKEVFAPNEKQATERIYTIIGSKHRLKRNYIKIDGVRLIDGE